MVHEAAAPACKAVWFRRAPPPRTGAFATQCVQYPRGPTTICVRVTLKQCHSFERNRTDAWFVTLSFPYLASQEKASLRAWERLPRMLVLNFGSPHLRRFLRDTAPKSSKGGAGFSGDHRRWQADCNRYAHALALSVYAVLVAPQHFPRISELVKKLKELSRRYETLRHNAQIFAAVASIIALGISSANKHTFHDHMKAALGNQSPHAVNHKTARDIVNGYYTTNSFGELPLDTFGSIIGLVSTDATTLEITKKPELKGHDILIEIDAAFDVIMLRSEERRVGKD